MEIKVRKRPRYTGAPDENCIHSLIVNGFEIGTYYGGKERKYLNPEKWAQEMIKKRLPVIERNIHRLVDELERWNKERDALTSSNAEAGTPAPKQII